jgi:predicted nucleic acid-binding protein
MSAPEFLDSNIILYAYDTSNLRKQKIAQELLKNSLAGAYVISVQVLAEVAAALLHKVAPARTPDVVAEILDDLAVIPTLSPDADIVRGAVQARSRYGVHFYDGMILAAAGRAGCKTIWSEDLNAGQDYFGMKVENPFA